MSESTPEPGLDGRRRESSRTSPAADLGSTHLRFPGGRVRPADWSALAQIATDHGCEVHLLPQGAVKLGGVTGSGVKTSDATGSDERGKSSLRDSIESAGMSPAVASGRTRTIIASPMAGRLEGHHDLGGLPELLDQKVRNSTCSDSLPGNFVFGLDSGSGDVLAHSPDLTVVAGPGGREVRIFVAGRDSGVEASAADAAGILVDVAAAFSLRVAKPSRISALDDEYHRVVVDLQQHPLAHLSAQRSGPNSSVREIASVWNSMPVEVPPVGWIDTSDGLVSLLAVVPDGVVSARLAEFLGAVDRASTISADRVIGLHALTEGMAEQVVRVLAPMGMIFDAASSWVEVAGRRGE